MHDPTCCTCTKVLLTWSDRGIWVDPGNLDEVADAVVCCALDHAYDRGHGVPYGFGSSARKALEAIVAKRLGLLDKGWLTATVELTEEERAALRADILLVLDEYRDELFD